MQPRRDSRRDSCRDVPCPALPVSRAQSIPCGILSPELRGLRLPLGRGGGLSSRNSSMDEADSRFLHLLQPIRDLTKNWEVDVAAQLAEYLGELDQISISFDNGKTTMNFLEAAMLIQGSACIYSKKALAALGRSRSLVALQISSRGWVIKSCFATKSWDVECF
ncbi:PREDICTED: uncharacterized protein LOC108447970 isoform X2 [Corvus brachyrhynchos]|uniref:uncharacterized protein LOC108447970 isoform X2 n=1 Tax=Corvus brachyrhynchos TaxID=85066 RepID=UPI00081649CA|nr:PREDICTED: uncharacterized protein LOC108447970 isoform X2 [Corvus brachyrhynchos]